MWSYKNKLIKYWVSIKKGKEVFLYIGFKYMY